MAAKEITRDEMIEMAGTPMAEVLAAKGITAESLAEALAAELQANQTQIVKLKDTPDTLFLPNGVEVLAQTTEETALAVEMINWAVRQKARMDAQKLLAQYPIEVKRITQDGTVRLEHGLDDQAEAIFNRVAEKFTPPEGE